MGSGSGSTPIKIFLAAFQQLSGLLVLYSVQQPHQELHQPRLMRAGLGALKCWRCAQIGRKPRAYPDSCGLEGDRMARISECNGIDLFPRGTLPVFGTSCASC